MAPSIKKIYFGIFFFLPFLLIIPVHSAATPQLIKTSGNPAVYWLNGSTRSPFPLGSIYKSWFGTSYSMITTITPDELASYTLSKNVLFKSGSLIKIQTDPKVYEVITDNGALQWIPSETEFKNRGFHFSDVRDVPDTFFSDYHIATQLDFATPQNQPVQNPTSTDTSKKIAPEIPPPQLAISSVTVTSAPDSTGQVQATIKYSTNMPAQTTIEYLADLSTTTTINLDTASVFSKKTPVFAGISYNYLITARSTDGSIATTTGSFMAYSDITFAVIKNIVPTNSLITQPTVLVGGFSLTNNSAQIRILQQLALEFDSSSNATSQIVKTLKIVRLKADGSVSDTLAEKTVSSGTSIVNNSSIQKIPMDESLAPGEMRQYGIVWQNLDQVNMGIISPSDSFVPLIAGLLFQGNDTTTNQFQAPLAKLFYFKQ